MFIEYKLLFIVLFIADVCKLIIDNFCFICYYAAPDADIKFGY